VTLMPPSARMLVPSMPDFGQGESTMEVMNHTHRWHGFTYHTGIHCHQMSLGSACWQATVPGGGPRAAPGSVGGHNTSSDVVRQARAVRPDISLRHMNQTG